MRRAGTARGLLFGVIAAFFWGTHSVIVQFLTGDLGGIEIAILRLWIAALTLFVVLRLIGEPVRIAFGDRNFLLAAGATVANYILFHIGLERTNAPSAMVLENTAPFFVLVYLALFTGTAVGLREIGATCIAIAGVVLTVVEDLDLGGRLLVGDALEIGAGITWAVFLVTSSRAMQASQTTGERLNFLFGVFTVAAVLLTPLGLAGFTVPPAEDLLPLLFLGVLATAVAYYFWYEAAAELSTLTATLLFALSVGFTFVNAALFLGTEIRPQAVLGAAMIVFAIFLTQTAKPKGAQ
ncbi:MAG: DMT family transporter [Rhodobacteraceae bacterium]|nr:DMT family transporter [Paracoccaceae bacterium]